MDWLCIHLHSSEQLFSIGGEDFYSRLVNISLPDDEKALD
jgi:hypothetical protein